LQAARDPDATREPIQLSDDHGFLHPPAPAADPWAPALPRPAGAEHHDGGEPVGAEAIGDRTREAMSHNVAYPLTSIALDTAGPSVAARIRGASPLAGAAAEERSTPWSPLISDYEDVRG
jgi:hypothetical protein